MSEICEMKSLCFMLEFLKRGICDLPPFALYVRIYTLIICKFPRGVKWVQNFTPYVRNTHFTPNMRYAKLSVG